MATATAAGALAWLALTGAGSATAGGTATDATAMKGIAEEGPGYAIEDFGYLTLEIPSVFAVKGNDYSAQVDMKVGAEDKTWDVNKNSWTAVGESADEHGREFMLMEIRTSK
ncbi:hypothetical protein [Streptomyces sp. NPDC048357]|uniref:hypothetical protein n=1 Tax=Streptomyces sp. NPDC048357 TaxID=3154719 RepID=UPI003448CBD7